MDLPLETRLFFFFFLKQLWKVKIFHARIYFHMKWSILSGSPKETGENWDDSIDQLFPSFIFF